MMKYLMRVGEGFIFGIRHPFMDVTKIPSERYDNKNFGEEILDAVGMSASQSIIQTGIGVVVSIGILAAVGYINEKINTAPKVKMVIDK